MTTTRRTFLGGAAALAACAVRAQDRTPTGDPALDAIQAELDEVEPADFKAYCRPSDPLELYVPQDGPPRFAALCRLDDAFRAVQRAVAETTVPAGGPPAVWYVYNMGIVVKTAQALFSVDLQHRFAEELAPSLDFALITHNHHDHYTRRFYDAMNGIQRKTVVSNFLDNYAAHFGKKAPGGFTRAEKIFTFKDVTVKTALSDHNGYLIDFTTTFEINAGGFRIFHTGDSQNIDKLNPADAPDLWVVHPHCGLKVEDGVRKFHPKKTVLAHFHELGHAKDRWRFRFKDGQKQIANVEGAGGVAVLPFWGDRLC